MYDLKHQKEKREPVSDIDTGVVDSLKALDPNWPIREADIIACWCDLLCYGGYHEAL